MKAIADSRMELPFTYLDEAMGMFDIERSPTSVHFEVQVAGQLDAKCLAEALVTAAQRHPMMRARQLSARAHHLRMRWCIEPRFQLNPLQMLDCPDDAALDQARDALFARRFTLDAAPPFRTLLARHPDGDRLIFNAIHQATDGIGLLRFVRSVQRAYAGEDDPVNGPDLQAARDLPRWLRPTDAAERSRREAGLAQVKQAARGAPSRLAVSGGHPRVANHVPLGHVLVNMSLQAHETQHLHQLRRHEATMNDVLLGVFMMACQRWNDLHGQTSDRLSAVMPINFRPREWQYEVVGNYLAVQPVMTFAHERADLPSAIAAVQRWTRLYKDTGCCGAPYTLASLGRLPVLAKRLLGGVLSDNHLDTGGFSNLGRFSPLGAFGAAGEAAGEVTGVWFSPPVRWPMGVCAGAVTLGSQMHITLRCSRNMVDRPGALRFADVFRQTLLLQA